MSKISTSVKVAEKLSQRIDLAVLKSGYGMRGKSRWIEEALTAFFALSDFPQYVDIATEQTHFDKTLTFRTKATVAKQLDAAVITVRKAYPAVNAAKSNIIRAALLQHLLR